MSSKSKKKPPSYTMTLTKAVGNALVIFMWAFCTEFSPDADQFERLKSQVQSVRDSILCGALTIPQIRKAIKDDYGWDVT
mgnify:CR=1 FL=1